MWRLWHAVQHYMHLRMQQTCRMCPPQALLHVPLFPHFFISIAVHNFACNNFHTCQLSRIIRETLRCRTNHLVSCMGHHISEIKASFPYSWLICELQVFPKYKKNCGSSNACYGLSPSSVHLSPNLPYRNLGAWVYLMRSVWVCVCVFWGGGGWHKKKKSPDVQRLASLNFWGGHTMKFWSCAQWYIQCCTVCSEIRLMSLIIKPIKA